MKYSIVQKNSMDGQLGQKTVLRDTMGCPLMSYIYPLGTEGWDGQVDSTMGPLGLRDGMDI